MTKEERNQLFGAIFIVIFALGSYWFYRYYNLQKTKKTFGIFIRDNKPSSHYLKYFKYYTESGEAIIAPNPYNNYLKIGDTVWIEYSLKDPNVIEILDKDYKKHLKTKSE